MGFLGRSSMYCSLQSDRYIIIIAYSGEHVRADEVAADAAKKTPCPPFYIVLHPQPV
jgi:hypothetical protein